VFGDEVGITLMELLPPVGWADIATKQDLLHLETVMSARFEAVDHRFDDIAREIRTLTWKLVTVVIAVVGTVAAAVRL
jgi:hypothetical protein